MGRVTDPKTHERVVPQLVIDYLVEGNSKEDLALLYARALCPFEFGLLKNEARKQELDYQKEISHERA